MCKSCKEHFDKYGKIYSFGLLLIVTVLVALLFLKVEALDLEVSKVQNTASQVKTEELKKLEPQPEPVVEEVVIEDNKEGTLPDSNAEKMPDTPAE